MDGTVLTGRIIEERADLVVFETESLGRLEIPRERIERLARGDARSGVVTDPDYNSIMFCPTPATLARGDSYFRDFELFFLNFGDDHSFSLTGFRPLEDTGDSFIAFPMVSYSAHF